MILFQPSAIIPEAYRLRYRVSRYMLFMLFISSGILFAYRTLFPSQSFLFSFTNPDTAKNTLEDPTATDGASLRKGRLAPGQILRTYAGTVGSFSSARIRLALEKDSRIPSDGNFRVIVRKSYRSFFFPDGEPLRTAPKERGFSVNGVPYLFSTDTLYPFVSDRAAVSRFPKEKILVANDDLLAIFPPQESGAGFREGSLLSDAQGVYVIGGDGKAHPIGSTEIFESLGFHWNDVIPVDEEELGFHKRGKIFLFDASQPDGTVFHDTEKNAYFVIENGTRRAIENREYLDSLLTTTTPIDASSSSLTVSASCVLERTAFSFINPTYTCDIPLDALASFPGGSFAVDLESGQDAHAASLSTTFLTKPDHGNLSLFIRQIRDRFSAAYGKK